MAAVVSPNIIFDTVGQGPLIPCAFHIVHVDGAFPLPEICHGPGSGRTLVAKLPADHSGLVVRPAVVTGCSPLAVDENLHAALFLTFSIHQSDRKPQGEPVSLAAGVAGEAHVFPMAAVMPSPWWPGTLKETGFPS